MNREWQRELAKSYAQHATQLDIARLAKKLEKILATDDRGGNIREAVGEALAEMQRVAGISDARDEGR